MENGKPMPTIKLIWNPDLQQVAVDFDKTEFQNPEFVIAILDMAKQGIEAMKRVLQVQAMQQAQAEAMRSQMLQEQVSRTLKLG